MPGWPSEPKALSATARRHIRETRFPIPTMIESFNLMADESAHRASLDRIRAAAALAHDLNAAEPPILQTVMGGRAGDWPKIRDTMASRLADWGKVAAESKIRLAVKAHAMNAVDTPAKLLALLDQVANPSIVAIYDYGHFQLRDLTIEQTMDEMIGRTSFITVKDSKVVDGKPQFLLPGEGTIDYGRYFRKVKDVGWKGWVLVEVSSQLFRQPGYDPILAAERSYAHLAPILASAGLR
jgi:sugar phosphate isomerase/epimerase